MTILSAATAALVGNRLPDGVDLLDRGEHRLRDIGGTERLFNDFQKFIPNPCPAP